ncbi:MAG TPA: DUF3501 family protein [Polyangiaceae bacterium]|jgi:hypothetical protein|nr:DUF3501 family protein [Polyangiaceae bacterium]
MQAIDRSELLTLGAYESIRDQFRARVIAAKARRRVALGDHITVLFENRDTVLLQIQEMLRTERITAEAGIQHEISTYNQLIPGLNELSATLFIEYTDAPERDRMLVALAGIEDKFYLRVNEVRCPVRNETGAADTSRTTAVHYVKFPLAPELTLAWKSGKAEAALGVDHPHYRAETVLSAATLATLAEDFA